MNPITNLGSQINSGTIAADNANAGGAKSTSLADSYGVNSHQTEAGSSSDKVSLSQSKEAATGLNRDGIKDESVSLSPRAARAQKIEAMAKDFFSTGDFSAADLPKLIQRLYQDGILSDTQLNRLSEGGFELPEIQGQPDDFKAFIQDKREELTASGDTQGMTGVLISLLDDAQSVLNQMDNAQSKEVGQQATRVSAQLNIYLKSDTQMSSSDREQWQGLKSMMQLASSMGENQQAVGMVNSYLSLGRF
ncbi:conserved protein of unknown function [Shewanella benthica]|uniref:Uncharacterized protein n=1 Tax=Shewanella benthica TaxID=43661 RepID=A0A330M1V5_9GAMM|nr:hypothetical protein [Shewanella benthica]SQH76151.1 conserved protein of unknown function [Shewanella benthica]